MVRSTACFAVGSLALLAVGCTPLDYLPPIVNHPQQLTANPPYEAVLVAGDGSLPVFDNATAAMRDRLVARGVPPRDILRLSAAGSANGAAAGLGETLAAIRAMHPSPGQVCFVYATSHGGQGDGLYMSAHDEFLTPAALDGALSAGCGEVPTVVVVSACYSGSFAREPMARPNRVILTAARADRPSFGCGAGRDFTVFDKCLLQGMDASAIWRGVYAMAQACVTAEETGLGYPASGPQAFYGTAAGDLRLPVPEWTD